MIAETMSTGVAVGIIFVVFLLLLYILSIVPLLSLLGEDVGTFEYRISFIIWVTLATTILLFILGYLVEMVIEIL